MPIHELTICCTPYHPQQTSATPQRAPELISLQGIGIKIYYPRPWALDPQQNDRLQMIASSVSVLL